MYFAFSPPKRYSLKNIISVVFLGLVTFLDAVVGSAQSILSASTLSPSTQPLYCSPSGLFKM